MADEPYTSGEADRLIAVSAVTQTSALAAIEERWHAHLRQHEEHEKRHSLEHFHESERTRLHEHTIDTAFSAHKDAHKAEGEAVRVALTNVDRMNSIHSAAHDREHLAHETRHEDARLAVSKGETAMDKRLESLNGVYGQMREQSNRFASAERLDGLVAAHNQRVADVVQMVQDKFESNRARIEAIEKSEVKSEGKSLGQGTIVAIIVGAVSFVGAVLSVIILLANVATGA